MSLPVQTFGGFPEQRLAHDQHSAGRRSTPVAFCSPYRGPSLAVLLEALRAGKGLSPGAGLAPARAAAASNLLSLEVPGLPEVRFAPCPPAHALGRSWTGVPCQTAATSAGSYYFNTTWLK